MPHIIIFNPTNGTRTLHNLEKRITKIGRLSGNDIILTDDRVSRYHAEILRHSEIDYIIKDLNSSNGTKVNGKKISTKELKDDDKMDIGRLIITFKAEDLFESPMDSTPPTIQTEKSEIFKQDDPNLKTIISGGSTTDFDTYYEEEATEVAKTVFAPQSEAPMVSTEAGAIKLDSRVEILSKKLKVKGETSVSEEEASTLSPPPPTLEGKRTAVIPPPFTAAEEETGLSDSSSPPRKKICQLQAPNTGPGSRISSVLFTAMMSFPKVNGTSFLQR